MFVLWLLLAFIVGGVCGIGLMCLLFMAKYNDVGGE